MGSEGSHPFRPMIQYPKLARNPANTGLRHRTRMGNCPLLRDKSSAHIRTATYMGKRRNRVCGADVHKDLIVTTIQSADGTEFQEKFGTTYSELEGFRDWVIANNCEQVAFEATGVYWFPVYDALSPSIDTIAANPWMIKGIPGDKSDAHDSKWIAENCLDGKIKRSRVFSKEIETSEL